MTKPEKTDEAAAVPHALGGYVGSRLRRLRKARGKTLAFVAERLGTTPQTIQRLETGGMTISLEWLGSICDTLDIHPMMVVTDAPDDAAVATTVSFAHLEEIIAQLRAIAALADILEALYLPPKTPNGATS